MGRGSKKKNKKIVDLMEEINELAIKHKRHLGPADVQQLEILRCKLAQYMDQKTKGIKVVGY